MAGKMAESINLPPRVWRALQNVARKYQGEGVQLFIFGSFARGDRRPTSDLDLGVEWHGPHRPELFTRLYWELQDLPTIRKIDLVDFAQVDPAFRRAALQNRIDLPVPESDDEKRSPESGF